MINESNASLQFSAFEGVHKLECVTQVILFIWLWTDPNLGTIKCSNRMIWYTE